MRERARAHQLWLSLVLVDAKPLYKCIGWTNGSAVKSICCFSRTQLPFSASRWWLTIICTLMKTVDFPNAI